MTSRTVMAARMSASSLHDGPRSVYVCVPEGTGPKFQEQIDSVLEKFIRAGDRLLYTGADTELDDFPDPVAAFGAWRGLFADPIEAELTEPDLVIVIIDPLGDNTHALTSPARVMALYQRADLVITELPDLNG